MGVGGTRWRVATVRGIPIYVSASWLLIAGFYLWATYVNFVEEFPVDGGAAFGLALIAGIMFFGSVLVHEGAHAVVARTFDLPVAGITLVFWGGATETRADMKGPKGELLVSVAGPASTFVVAGLLYVVAILTNGLVSEVARDVAGINLLFGALNSLPGYPLDGGRVLMAAVWRFTGNRLTAMRAAGYGGVGVGVVFLALGGWMFLRSDGQLTIAIFLFYLGFVLVSVGRGMERRIGIREQLSRGRVGDAMSAPPQSVPANVSLSEALDGFLRGAGDAWFPVVEPDGQVIGTITFASARRVGARDPLRPVRDGAILLSMTPTLAPDDGLGDAVDWLAGKRGLVLHEGRLVGAIGPSEIEAWYRREVEGAPAPMSGDQPAGVPPRPDR